MALPDKPLTRRETYLAKAAGQEVTLPETDLTREELYLRAIAEGGGGGGTSPFYPAGNTAFASLPELSADILGAMYNITDAFTTDSRFNEGAGVDYPAGTNVAVVNVGTAESPVLKYDTFAGAYVVDNALSDASENPVQNKVIKSALDGKATPADIAALINDTTAAQNKTYSSAKVEEKVAGEEITVSATGSDLTLSTSSGNVNKLTVYGKSEVVDGAIKSAGEGYAVVRLTDLGWLYAAESSQTNPLFYSRGIITLVAKPSTSSDKANILCTNYVTESDATVTSNKQIDNEIAIGVNGYVYIVDKQYTTVEDFVASLGDATLTYQLADPTQGNTIAVKTDNGTGIDGTMAVFETGTPLYGVSDTVRDVMQWNGSVGTVTKKCRKTVITSTGNLNKWESAVNGFYASLGLPTKTTPENTPMSAISNVTVKSRDELIISNEVAIGCNVAGSNILLIIPSATTIEEAQVYLQNNPITIIYELATHTTTPLTQTENESIAGLRTFAPQTHAQNNAGADMTVEAYAGTANGKAVNELKQDVQSEISALKITQSGTLTLTVAGWSDNAQVIAYAHDTAKRNVIDVDPASVEEWAACGVLATAETASGITFTCKAVPTNALNFKVTSMGV